MTVILLLLNILYTTDIYSVSRIKAFLKLITAQTAQPFAGSSSVNLKIGINRIFHAIQLL